MEGMEAKIYLKHFDPNYDKTSAGTIYFRDEINSDSVLYLIDLMESAFVYYQYKELNINIESPGGSVSALDLIIDKFKEFQERKKNITTKAVMAAASAAAIMVTAGDIGKRGVNKNSFILYHKSRISEEKTITVNKLDELRAELIKIDEKMLDFLVERGLKTLEFNFKKICSDRSIGKNRIAEQYVNDLLQVIKERTIYFKNEEKLESLKDEYLDKFRQYYNSIKNFEPEDDETETVKNIKDIFYGIYDSLTDNDFRLSPEEAQSLFLIDRVI